MSPKQTREGAASRTGSKKGKGCRLTLPIKRDQREDAEPGCVRSNQGTRPSTPHFQICCPRSLALSWGLFFLEQEAGAGPKNVELQGCCFSSESSCRIGLWASGKLSRLGCMSRYFGQDILSSQDCMACGVGWQCL